MNIRHLLSFTFVCLLLIFSLPLYAQMLELPSVPDSLPAFQRQALVKKRADLLRKWDYFLGKKAAFIAASQGIKVPSPEADAAAKRKAQLMAENEAIVAEARIFAQDIQRVAKSTPPERKEWLPVSPAWFAMPNQAKFARDQINALNRQTKFLENQRTILKGIEKGEQQLVLENVTATLDLMQDTECQTLTVIGGLLSMANLPPKTAETIGIAFPAIHGYFIYRGFESATDERRTREKMLDGIGEIKNLVLSFPKILPGAEGESTKSATDAVLKIYKVIDRHSTPNLGPASIRADLEDVMGAVSDVVQAVDPKMGGALKATTGFPSLPIAARALGLLKRDRAEIERALNQNATALSYYENRLGDVQRDLKFWHERLSQTEQEKK